MVVVNVQAFEIETWSRHGNLVHVDDYFPNGRTGKSRFCPLPRPAFESRST
jgi:hypothetical protein